jgi:predicted alpha-1,2-mannosidase
MDQKNILMELKKMSTPKRFFPAVIIIYLIFSQLLMGNVPVNAAMMNLTQYVDPFIGTTGGANLYPGAQAPFGMIQFSPDTGIKNAGANYAKGDPYLQDFSLLHFSGYGMKSGANLPFIPTVGTLGTSPVNNRTAYQSSYANETAAPGYYKVDLTTPGINVELATTTRAGFGKFTYPGSTNSALLFAPSNCALGMLDSNLQIDPVNKKISGWTRSQTYGNTTAAKFTVYFCAKFDQAFTSYGTWNDSVRNDGSTGISGPNAAVYVKFNTSTNTVVNMKVAISFVSVAGAELNLNTEIPNWSLSEIKTAADTAWNNLLNKIQVSGGTTVATKRFYTAIYHSCMQPSVFSDVDGKYIGFDDAIYTVATGHNLYTNFCLWDTYRAQPQLLALIANAEASDMAQSLLLIAQHTYSNGLGFPGKAIYNDDVNSMGTYPVPIFIANAYAFGVKNFDTAAMKDRLIDCAMNTNPFRQCKSPDLNGATWWGLDIYKSRGWVDKVSDTLEYSQTDCAIAMFCQALGDTANYNYFLQRSQNIFNLANPNANGAGECYLQRKDTSGNWVTPFSPTAEDGFMEGNSAQYTWGIPHNLKKLIQVFGGNSKFVSRLDSHTSQYVTGWPTTSPYWWVGNEPGLGVPFGYNWAQNPAKLQAKIYDVLDKVFTTGTNGIPGNDDSGVISSWIAFCSIGLYPEIPGVGGFTIFTPQFSNITLALPNNKTVTINTPNVSATNFYIQSMKVNGVNSTSTWATMDTLTSGTGATLDFVVGGSASAWGTGAADVPPSFEIISGTPTPTLTPGPTATPTPTPTPASTPGPTSTPGFGTIIVEAETGTLSGTVTSTSRTGYSGSGYVTGFDTTGDAVTVNVNVTSAGSYTLKIRYASEFEDKPNYVYVNGTNLGEKNFTQTTTFTELNLGAVSLNAGNNSLKVENSWGWIDVDYFKVEGGSSATPSPTPGPTSTPTPTPIPGGDLCTGGTSSASAVQTGQTAAEAFDNNFTTSKWIAAATTAWIQYQFGGGNAYVVTRYTLTSGNDIPGRDPKNWQLQGSNDGTAWTTVDTRTGITFASRLMTQSFSFTNTTAYRYYRVNITLNNGDAKTCLEEVEMTQ